MAYDVVLHPSYWETLYSVAYSNSIIMSLDKGQFSFLC